MKKALIISVICIALALTATVAVATSDALAPYATFEHGGREYFVSAAYQEGTWEESLAWCESIGEGYRLPTLDEAIAMRNNWNGNDPMDAEPPAICQGFPSTGVVELWTSTECGSKKAYAIHKLSTTIIDRTGMIECENESEDSHFCCMPQKNYGPTHACPLARCVQPRGPEGCLMDFVEPFGARDFYDLLQWLRYARANDLHADLTGDGLLNQRDTDTALRIYLYHSGPCP